MIFHVAMSCSGILREPPEVVGAMLKDAATGRTLESHEVYALAVTYQARGFEVIPPCCNHNSKGYCTGHESSPDDFDCPSPAQHLRD